LISFVTYGFGNASGKGFGAALKLWNGAVFYRQGIWEYRITDKQSSNYRERNLVDSLERAAEKGFLDGTEIWMFTDNSVAEAAFSRGSSKSRELNHLVVRLSRLEMELGVRIMVVHVSGKRMILTGIDKVSRGDMNAGVMAGAGADMLSYVPLHLSSLQRPPSLRGWLEEWIGDGGLFLEASDWPRKHLNHGTYVWSPPPAASPAALEWLGESIHKRPTLMHVIVIPRLLTALWRTQLGKLTDGDASGKGFGAALKLWNGVVLYRQGIWEYWITDKQSSNYRELRNLVYSLERAAEKGLLNGTEIWMFTDNSVVAEAAFFSWIIQVERT
jgi:hypothetical protein